MQSQFIDLQPVLLTSEEVQALLAHSSIDPLEDPHAFTLREAVSRRMENIENWEDAPSLRDVRQRLNSIASFTETLASVSDRMAIETDGLDAATVLGACRKLRGQLHLATLLLLRSCGIMHELMPDLPEWDDGETDEVPQSVQQVGGA